MPAFAQDENELGVDVFERCSIIRGEEFRNHRVTTPNEREAVEDGGNDIN
jgi:hypothetical protein